MFELGFSEIILIAIVAIIVMGPEQLPKVLYKLGKWARQLSYTRYALERQFEAFMDKEEHRERADGNNGKSTITIAQQQPDSPPDRTA